MNIDFTTLFMGIAIGVIFSSIIHFITDKKMRDTIKEMHKNNSRLITTDYYFKDIPIDKIEEQFNNLISREFLIYQQLHPKYFINGSYIKSIDMQKIIEEATARVFVRITPTIKEQLSLIYNIKEDKDIINIIGEKIGLITVGITKEVNKDIQDDLTTINI